eukprot:2290993-Rhodomonas_salina.2
MSRTQCEGRRGKGGRGGGGEEKDDEERVAKEGGEGRGRGRGGEKERGEEGKSLVPPDAASDRASHITARTSHSTARTSVLDIAKHARRLVAEHTPVCGTTQPTSCSTTAYVSPGHRVLST